MENISSGKRKKELKNEEKNKAEVKTAALERLAERAAEAIGSVPSLVAHSIFFVGIFSLLFFGFSFDQILLILTTVVSLEAIYLAIFIQMTVNRHSENIEEVREDIEDIQEDVEDISEDIDEISTEDIDLPKDPTSSTVVLNNIESQLQFLIKEVEILKGQKKGQ
jgi:low affinity Fe/Cu permease